MPSPGKYNIETSSAEGEGQLHSHAWDLSGRMGGLVYGTSTDEGGGGG